LVYYTDPNDRSPEGKPNRFRFRFAQEADARKKLKTLQQEAAIGGIGALVMDDRLRADAYAARRALDQADCQEASIVEAVRGWIASRPAAARVDQPIDDLLNEFIESKEREERRASPTCAGGWAHGSRPTRSRTWRKSTR